MPDKKLAGPKVGIGYGGGAGGDVGSGGYSGPNSGGGGGGTSILDTLVSSGGSLLSDAISNALGNLGGQALSNALLGLGLPENVVSILTGAAQGLAGSTEAGGGPSIRLATEFIAGKIPFDPGGFGGGVLSSGVYMGQAGALAGALLKSKKIKLGQLLTGGNNSVLAQLYGRFN